MTPDERAQKLRRLLESAGLEEAAAALGRSAAENDPPAWLQRVAEAAATLPLPEVPPVVSQDLCRLYDVTAEVESAHAVLVLDTRTPRELSTVRGSEAGEGWSMTYTSAVADVVLDVMPHEDGKLDLSGHIMAHRGADAAYRVRAEGPTAAVASGDRLGRFRLGPVRPGSYVVVMSDGEIELTLTADLEEQMP